MGPVFTAKAFLQQLHSVLTLSKTTMLLKMLKAAADQHSAE